MTFGSLSRWSLVRTGLAGVLGGGVFGVMFSSVTAGVLAAVVFALATLDPREDDGAPGEGPRTLTIDLERR